MTDTISARLNNLITPLHRWRGLGGVGKYALYTRVSLQLIPVSVALGYLVAVINAVPTVDIPPWRMADGGGQWLYFVSPRIRHRGF